MAPRAKVRAPASGPPKVSPLLGLESLPLLQVALGWTAVGAPVGPSHPLGCSVPASACALGRACGRGMAGTIPPCQAHDLGGESPLGCHGGPDRGSAPPEARTQKRLAPKLLVIPAVGASQGGEDEG